MNDKLRKLLKDNPDFFIHVFFNALDNRVGLLKDKFGLSEKEVDKIHNDFLYTNFKYLKKKKPIKRVSKIRERLSSNQVSMDKENLSVSIPQNCILSEQDKEDLVKLESFGYTVIHATIPLILF